MSTELFDSDVRNRRIDPVIQHGETNKRARDCRRCRQDTPKGIGTLARDWSNGRCIETYLCPRCVSAVDAILNPQKEVANA